MADNMIQRVSQNMIPDDPEAQRSTGSSSSRPNARASCRTARAACCRPLKKPTVAAMEEVRRGLVQYADIAIQHGIEEVPAQE